MEIDKFLQKMVEKGASDLYIRAGSKVVARVGDELEIFSGEALSGEETKKIALSILNDAQKEKFLQKNEMDVAYASPGVGRFRMNIYMQRGTVATAVRSVKTGIPSFEELNLPQSLKKISMIQKGLALITGPTGCGKTTTLAAIIDYINTHKSRHIVTIEDPIEFLHKDKMSVVCQREVGIDTDSFTEAMIHVVRQNPDVILIGEMRDVESFNAAISASETGHFVLSTLHTSDVAQSIDRIMDFFPDTQHNQIRAILSMNLKAMVCQKLISKMGTKELVPAVEVMFVDPGIKKLIRENRINRISAAIQAARDDGMQTFNQSLVELVESEKISEEDALTNSSNPAGLKMNLQGIYLDEEKGIIGED